MKKTIFLIWALMAFCVHAEEPLALYATYQENPEGAITLCWISNEAKNQELKFHSLDSNQWYAVTAHPESFPEKLPYAFYCVELHNLLPDQKYEFLISEGSSHYFNTLPKDLTRPLKFVVGGDIYHDGIDLLKKMNQMAANLNPDFVILGGDIAYQEQFHASHNEKWIDFFKIWSQTMVKKDGSLIPFVSVIGNHDVKGGFDKKPQDAPFYYFLFPSHENKYRMLSLGNYLNLWLLDSGHTASVKGEQRQWLSETLQKNSSAPFRMAVYHVPAYPCVRSFTNKESTDVRDAWTPLFDKYQLTAAFEHHDHAYKRTHLIKKGKVDPEGVLYIGDGAWGVQNPREPHSLRKKKYIASIARLRHVILVTLTPSSALFQGINEQGEVFDSFTR